MRQRLRAALLVLAFVAVAVLPIVPGETQAQGGGTLSYGAKVFGRVLADSPTVIYSFSGTANDLVQVSVRNWAGTLDPRIDLVGPDGQTIAVSTTNPFSEDPLEAGLARYLPQAGTYMLLVSAERGTIGEFVLRLQGRGVITAVPLVYGQGVNVTIPLNPVPQYFSFEVQNCPTILTVSNLSLGQPFTFPFLVHLRNEQGTLIARLAGGDALEDRVVLPPLSGRYEVEVSSEDPLVQGQIHLLVSCADQAPGCLGGPAGAVSAPGGTASGVECPPCFPDDFEGGPCAEFEITVTPGPDLRYTFTWPEVEGAEYYIFSIIDSTGILVADSPRLLVGETSNEYQFKPVDALRAPFTVIVNAASEGEGYLCTDREQVAFEAPPESECTGINVTLSAVPGASRMAVAAWDPAPGAAAYTLHVYAVDEADDSLIGIRVFIVPGDATTYHLVDVFPADYTRFIVQVRAYSAASGGGAFGDLPQGYLCGGEASIAFTPLGPVEWGAEV